MSHNLTENEIEMLKCICDSQYHDGRHPVNDSQWFENPFPSMRTASGVCSSLSKKGYARFAFAGTEDHQFMITQLGFDELAKADPEYVRQFENKVPETLD